MRPLQLLWPGQPSPNSPGAGEQEGWLAVLSRALVALPLGRAARPVSPGHNSCTPRTLLLCRRASGHLELSVSDKRAEEGPHLSS